MNIKDKIPSLLFLFSFFYFLLICSLLYFLLSDSNLVFDYNNSGVFFYSNDAAKFWWTSSRIASKISYSLDFFNQLRLFDNNLFLKIMVFFKYFFGIDNKYFYIFICIFVNSINSVLIYLVSLKIFEYKKVKSNFFPFIISIIYILSPYSIIWYSSPVDESLIILSVLLLVYLTVNLFFEKKYSFISLFLMFFALIILVLARYQFFILFFLILFMFFSFEALKKTNLKINYLILSITVILFLFAIYYLIEVSDLQRMFLLNVSHDSYNSLQDYITYFKKIINSSLKISSFFRPNNINLININTIPDIVYWFESVINFIFLPGFILFFISKNDLFLKLIFIFLFLYVLNLYLIIDNDGTLIRLTYLVKIYYLILSSLSYQKLINNYSTIRTNFKSLEMIFFLFINYITIILFFFRDVIIVNLNINEDLINILISSFFYLNIFTFIFLYPLYERLNSINSKIKYSIYLPYFLKISVFAFVIFSIIFSLIFFLFSYNFTSYKILFFVLIVFLLIPSSLILFLNSFLIKNNFQLLGSLSHLFVPIVVLFSILIGRNYQSAVLYFAYFGTLIGILVNLSFIFFTNIILKTSKVNFNMNFKFIKTKISFINLLYQRYFFPSIYLFILILINILILNFQNIPHLFVWIIAIKIPLSLTFIFYSMFINYISNYKTEKIILFKNNSYIFVTIVSSICIVMILLSNLIGNLIFYKNIRDLFYLDLFVIYFRFNSLIPIITIIILFCLRSYNVSNLYKIIVYISFFTLFILYLVSFFFKDIFAYYFLINIFTLLIYLLSINYKEKVYGLFQK